MRSHLGRFLLALSLLVACGDDDGAPDARTDTSTDTGDGEDTARDTSRPPPVMTMCVDALPVDLVFVVDNSSSMAEEQNNLVQNFPRLIEVLTEPRDSDGDGTFDPPLKDLRVAVVTTDIGVGPHAVAGCDATGDGGAFIRETRSLDPACSGVTAGDEGWVSFDGTNSEDVASRFRCLASLGTSGCGLEQQLEAMQSALDETAAGGANAGFLRDDSLLAVVFVTDEDDCSASDDRVFSPDADELGPYNTRCANHPELLHPISRYADTLRALGATRPGGVIVAAITGAPINLTMDPSNVDFTRLLADERMQYREDPARPGALVPACEFAAVGSAPPARRMVELVAEFASDDAGLLYSICQPDLRPAIEAIANTVRERICPPPI